MPTNEVLINREHKVLLIREIGATGSFPGFEPFDTFSHGTDHDPQGWVGNHVDYHHLRDILYRHGEPWAQDFMFMRAKAHETPPIDPLVPGPLDFFIDTNREVTGTVPFQMALPNCILMIVTHSDVRNPPMRTIEATHGGEPMTRVHGYSYWYHQVDFFIGTGLTLEEADLVIAEKDGVPITPIVGRILDFADEPVFGKAGMSRGYQATFPVFISADLPFYSKSVFTSDQAIQLLKAEGQEILTNRRESTGEVIPYNPTFGEGWAVAGTTWTHTGDTSVLEGLIDGDQDTTHSNGVVADIELGENSSLLIQFMSPNGASRNVTYAGPFKQTVHEPFSASGAYYHAVKITAYNNVVIKNLKVKKDMIAVSVIMGHTAEPIAEIPYSVEYTASRQLYADVAAITYTLEAQS